MVRDVIEASDPEKYGDIVYTTCIAMYARFIIGTELMITVKL